MKAVRNVLVLLLFAAAQSFAQGYKLVWSDEFDSTALDQSKWTCEIGNNNGWGNNELEYYTDRTQNCSVANGCLTITAQKESYNGFSYTSARIKTQGKFSFEYGKAEARIKLPYGKGIWPAFWMLGDNITSVGWPTCGENDIMEMIGGTGSGGYNSTLSDATVYGTLHWEQNGNAQAGGKYTLSSGPFSYSYHTFGAIWTPQKIQFYVDNTIYYSVDVTPTGLSAFHNKFFIILNLAVGGNWPGYPDTTTVFPQKMLVDYVRVYQEDTTDSGTAVIDLRNRLAGGFSLGQNFPNPFNPTTRISYRLPQSTYVDMRVYDSLGREVQKLVDSRQHAGDHTVAFNGDDLPSGVYLCVLDAGSFRDVRKMILIK